MKNKPGKKPKKNYDFAKWNAEHEICDSYLYRLAQILNNRARYDRDEPIEKDEFFEEEDLTDVQDTIY